VDNNPQTKKRFRINSYIGPKENPRGFLVSIFIFLAFLGVGIYTAVGSNPPQENKRPEEKPVFTPLSNNTVVYGYWTEKNSKINAVDLSSGKIYNLATLDKDVKKTTVVSSQAVIFINKTDGDDNGRELAFYDLGTKSIMSLFQADENFGINDYVISPGKRYVADWEIQNPANSQGLIGGRSRVYSIDLQNPTQKNLIHDEAIQEGVPISYPVGVTDSAEVFLDGFIANNSAGWASGMSFSNFAGTDKQNIPSMTVGTYSTQPVLSSDGNYLAFAGYDGSLGTGTTDGFRDAILNPNTVEILGTTTKERRKLFGLSNVNRYTSVFWDKSLNNIIFSMTSKDISQNGFYLYDLGSSSYRKIGVSQDGSVISTLSNTQFLTGSSDTTSAIGNLGPKYTSTFSSISVYDSIQNKITAIDVGTSLVQYIGLFPSNYFNNSLVIGRVGDSASKSKNNQLQLETFAFKPTLAPKREERQSKPPVSNPICQSEPAACPNCDELSRQQCASLGFKNDVKGSKDWFQCVAETKISLKTSGACYNSPLYLYGNEGTKVEIKVNTKITNPIPYSDGNYSVLLGNKGQLGINGKNYSSINFSYAPAIEMPNLDYGRIVKPADVGKVLGEYGQKLGLNEREISDLKNSARVSSPYILVSFFSDEISKKILPISFNPVPDVYRNIVFYFKELDFPMSIKEPKFENIPTRKGFTAVEISHIIY